MSARDLAGAAWSGLPAQGFNGSVRVNYVGNRYLNKRNTALAEAHSPALGRRSATAARSWEVRLVAART